MSTTWFVVESEPGKIVAMEIHPRMADGTLKHFILDGEGFLWMPYTNPPANIVGAPKPFRIGKLVVVTLGAPPVSLIEKIARGKEVVLIPATNG
jgi:hypothetical protein